MFWLNYWDFVWNPRNLFFERNRSLVTNGYIKSSIKSKKVSVTDISQRVSGKIRVKQKIESNNRQVHWKLWKIPNSSKNVKNM